MQNQNTTISGSMMSTIKQQTFCHYDTPFIFTTFVAKTIAMKLRSKLIVINLQIHHVKCSRYTEQDYTSKLRGIRVYNRSRCVFSSTVSEGPTTWIERRWYKVVVLITSTLFCSIAVSYCYCRADVDINLLLTFYFEYLFGREYVVTFVMKLTRNWTHI